MPLSVLINLRFKTIIMPRRSILSAADRESSSWLGLDEQRWDLIRRYTLSPSDIPIIRQRRGAANRLGFAVQLCYLRYPGVVLGVDQLPFSPLLHLVAGQLKIPVEHWAEYGDRAQDKARASRRTPNSLRLRTLHGSSSQARRPGTDRDGDANGQRRCTCDRADREATGAGDSSSPIECDRTCLRRGHYRGRTGESTSN